MVLSHQKELELKHSERERELKQRALELKRAKQHDSKMVAKLKAIWKERDELYYSGSRKLTNEYTCEVCNRPFTTPRKISSYQAHRCPPCTAFMRKKFQRESYYRNREERLAKRKLYPKRKEVIEEPVKHEHPVQEKHPVVVWQPSI